MINKMLKIKNNELYTKFNNEEIGILVDNQEQMKLLVDDIFYKKYEGIGDMYYYKFPFIVEDSFFYKNPDYNINCGDRCGHRYISQFFKIDSYKKEKVDFNAIFHIKYK